MQAKPESVLISEVAARVHARVPQQRRADVDRVVEDLWREYRQARVRDFVPVFVERDAVEQIRSRLSVGAA